MGNYRLNEGLLADGQASVTLPVGNTQALPMPSWGLDARQLCDLEMLLTGAYAPLTRFMGLSDYRSVVDNMQLANGQFWPMPIVLGVTKAFADSLALGVAIALRDLEGVLLATLVLEECWLADTERPPPRLGQGGKTTPPDIESRHTSPSVYLTGELCAVELAKHPSHLPYSRTPAQLRAHFLKDDGVGVIALQPQHTLHRAQWEAICEYAQQQRAGLLVQVALGISRAGQASLFVRFRCQEYTIRHSPAPATPLNVLNIAYDTTDARVILLSTLVQRNYGCTHFMADVGQAKALRPYTAKLGIPILTMPPTSPQYAALIRLSDAGLSQHLYQGLPVPDGYSFPEVLVEIQKNHPPKHQQGFAVFFTGLSGSGKSTLANALWVKLMEMGGRSITLLDGDAVRKHLSSELDYSKAHRDINIRRIGFVASEIVKHRGIAICAPIAPYAKIRQEVRDMVASQGGFVEVHVATPLSKCEKRDRKGLYAKARAGLIKGFTGIDDPYEIPENPELRIDTRHLTPEQCIGQLLKTLRQLGYIRH